MHGSQSVWFSSVSFFLFPRCIVHCHWLQSILGSIYFARLVIWLSVSLSRIFGFQIRLAWVFAMACRGLCNSCAYLYCIRNINVHLHRNFWSLFLVLCTSSWEFFAYILSAYLMVFDCFNRVATFIHLQATILHMLLDPEAWVYSYISSCMFIRENLELEAI